jgi:hypothetical protein
MAFNDHIYRSFEEFEREELRRFETQGASVDDMIDTIFGEELDVEGAPAGRKQSYSNDDDE